jgi:hypothetical protein
VPDPREDRKQGWLHDQAVAIRESLLAFPELGGSAGLRRSKGELGSCVVCGNEKRWATGECATCGTRRGREWVERNPEKRKKIAREYGRRNLDKIAAWKEANPEAARTAQARYRKRHPEVQREAQSRRRARKLGAPEIEKIDRNYIYDRDGGRCHLCEKKVPRTRFDLDHLIPLSKGGPHTHLNLRVLLAGRATREGAMDGLRPNFSWWRDG